MDVREILCGDVYIIHLTHHRNLWKVLVNMVRNIRVPYKVGNHSTN
jgi:hypothetical protein